MSERISINALRFALALALALAAAATSAQSTTNAVKRDCALCHGAHGGFAFLLKASDVETLCQSCHGPGGIATQAAVHTKARPSYNPFRISCTGCHNSHTDLWNQIGTRNVDLIATNEARLLREVLEECNWNKTTAALRLGVSRSTLYEKIKKYQIFAPTLH